jgi:hypothetical protein
MKHFSKHGQVITTNKEAMNTIERIKLVDDRLYLKIVFNSADTVDLRFYLPDNLDEFIKLFSKAINNTSLALQKGEWEERDEEFLHEDIIRPAMYFIRSSGFTNFLLIGVYQKKWLRFTDLTREYFAVYMHNDFLTAEMIEIFPSMEEALITLLKWRADDSKFYRFQKRKDQRTTYDAVISDFLYSIDTVDHFIMYKALYPDQLEYIVKKGLVILTR